MNSSNNSIYTGPSKREFIESYLDWFKSLSESWMPLATTVVFQSSGYQPKPEYWLHEYKHTFLHKISKILSRRSKDSVLYSDFCEYEFGESGLYKSVKDQRSPHHVHGVIFIPNELVKKVWNSENKSITDRLEKDIRSIKCISSALIEPIREGEMNKWIGYTMKNKSFQN